MRLLLDTHALLWWWADDPQLPSAARAALADESNEVLVSAATAWEIATKQRIGKLPPWPMPAGGFDALVAAVRTVNSHTRECGGCGGRAERTL